MSTLNLQVAIADTMSVDASTPALVNNGAQNAYLGEEIVGIVDATDQGGGQYQIGPGLVRGIRGSPQGNHQAGETFAFAPSIESATKVRVDDQYIGRRVYVRVLSPGQDIDDAIELSCIVVAPRPPYVTSLPQWANETPSGTVDGANATFALSHAPLVNSLTLTLCGAPEGGSDYTLTGTTIVFMAPPPIDSTLNAQYQYLP